MGVIRVKEQVMSSAGVDRSLVQTFDRFFWVYVTAETTDAQVLRHPSIPKPYERHPDFSAALVDDVRIERLTWKLYSVEVAYTTRLEPGQQRELPRNPLSRPAEVEMSSVKRRVLIDTDWEGNPIDNAAGELILGVEEEETLWQFDIVKNVPAAPAWLKKYSNAVNQEAVLLKGQRWPKHTLKVDGVRLPKEQIENNVEFIPLQLRILHREQGWRRVFLNTGFKEKFKHRDPASGTFVDALRDIRIGFPPRPTDKPIPLDKDGRARRRRVRLADGRIVQVVRTTATKAELKSTLRLFDTKPILPFRNLPLR